MWSDVQFQQQSILLFKSLEIEKGRELFQIKEITGMEGTTVLSQTIAAYEDDKLEFQGIVPKNMAKLNHMGGLPIDFFGRAKQ